MRPLHSKSPMDSILNPGFAYKYSWQTDIRKTFAAYRKRMAKEQEQSNVKPLRAKGR